MATGAILSGAGLVESLDRRLLDAQFRFLRANFPQAAPAEIVIVGIDEATVVTMQEPLALWHRHFGAFLDAAAAAGAKAVGLDVILPDRSYNDVIAGSDQRLLAGLLAMRRAGVLVLAVTVDDSGRPRRVHPAFLAAAGPDGSGFALWKVDPDGAVRVFDERLGDRGETAPTFAGQLARRLGMAPRAGMINYAIGERFDYTALERVLAWQREGAHAELARAFRGKIVLLGTVLPFQDQHPSPVLLGARNEDRRMTPGVILQAQTLRTLLADRVISTVHPALVALLAAVCTLTWIGGARPTVAAVTAFAALAAILALGTFLLARDVYLPSASLAVAALIGVSARLGLESGVAIHDRRRLRAAFAGYVSPHVMTEIEAGRLTGLQGDRYFVCTLFLDVRGFTTRSESTPPERMIRLLNRFFEEATAAIHERNGTIDKFTGDGIMAVFGAPARMDNPCELAFDAAREILERLERLNVSLAAEGELPIAIGIGLACGEAVVGHVGAAARHAYTAMGDTVNVAARLEGLTKELGYPLVMSSEVAARVRADDRLVPLGTQPIKGHTPVEVFGLQP
ncbi:MAG: adenylate/guanylate cyclase domain-containing protein [Burkholderiales bacterium]|nr:adenylate/guanylate cyclase domain-containing protein [Burkholderiales bacterium]